MDLTLLCKGRASCNASFIRGHPYRSHTPLGRASCNNHMFLTPGQGPMVELQVLNFKSRVLDKLSRSVIVGLLSPARLG